MQSFLITVKCGLAVGKKQFLHRPTVETMILSNIITISIKKIL